MTISRNSTGVNVLKDLLKELLMPQEFHVPASFVKRVFLEPRRLYSCLKSQKTISDYYFNSNNCYNRTFVHIIRTVISIAT